MQSLHWDIKKFKGLTIDELYDLLRLRVNVFVVEQTCPYPELDGKDTHEETLHMTALTENHTPAAYLRILAPGVSYPDVSFGRVVVAENFRGKGLSHTLIENAVAVIQETWPGQQITIGAQEYLKSFYQSHGFVPVSDTYLEDGIPHIDMTRKQA
ncbi:MAG: GNAT family N-acetyltransferase [Desulfobacteraceae bacterium]|nr:GNAT family N-acetyltransferase [Desulfobacteraceae bacterium]